MPLSGGCFGSSLGSKVDEIDVVDDHVRIVFLAPLFAKGVVKPSVVSRDEMAPLKNFQSLLLGSSPLGKEKGRASASGDSSCATASSLYELTARELSVFLFFHWRSTNLTEIQSSRQENWPGNGF